MQRYSALVEERATVDCFLAHQEIGFEPKNTQKPLVERRSDGDLAQSASQKAYRRNRPGPKWSPWVIVPFRKRRIRLAAMK